MVLRRQAPRTTQTALELEPLDNPQQWDIQRMVDTEQPAVMTGNMT
jgi:hypothetical protein